MYVYRGDGDGGWEELLELGNERRGVFWSEVGRIILLRPAASLKLPYTL